MEWFDERLTKCEQNDRENLEDTFLGLADAIVGKRLENSLKNNVTISQALGYILQYYHIPYEEDDIPKSIEDINEQIDYICSQRNILHREVALTDKWYKDANGPMLGVLKEDGRAVAIIPNKTFGYSFYDVKSGEIVRVNKKTAKLLCKQATYFYQPLPIKKIKIFDLFKFMLQQLKFFDIVIFFLMLTITTLLGVMPPYFTQWLFGFVVARKDLLILFSLTIFMITFSLCTIFVTVIKNFFNARIGKKISLALNAAVMQRILSFPPSFHQKYAAGDLSQRKDCVLKLADDIENSIVITSITSVFSLAYLGQMTSFAPSLTVTSLIIIFINVVFSMIIVASNIKISQKRLQVTIAESAMSYAMINSIQKIKLSGAETRMFNRWGKLYTNHVKLTYNPPFFIKYSSIIGTLISIASTFILYFVAIENKVGVANFLAFNAAYASVSAGITALTNIAGAIGQLRPTYKIVRPILDTMPESNVNKLNIVDLKGNIELANISFKYDNSLTEVISDLSLTIRPNDYIAIVGPTGCGKSTLVKLLLGFEKPQKGNIYYDHTDINLINLQSLRQKIGTVMQNAKLFNVDIYTNITISAHGIDEAEAWKAAKIAAIDEDIKAMPMGMKTMISEGQGGISGGQRQRIAIARAVAPNPKILIFDEATSSLDNLSQKKVSNAIDKLHCTRIVIAHRLTTIKNCNRIVVLDKGHIVEDGTFDELIAKNGTFAELVKRQRLDLDDKELE